MQQHKYENAGAIFCQQLYAIRDSKSPKNLLSYRYLRNHIAGIEVFCSNGISNFFYVS